MIQDSRENAVCLRQYEDAYTFHGTYFIYMGKRIDLNDRTFLLDGRMKDDAVLKYAHVYRNLKTALEAVNAQAIGRERIEGQERVKGQEQARGQERAGEQERTKGQERVKGQEQARGQEHAGEQERTKGRERIEGQEQAQGQEQAEEEEPGAKLSERDKSFGGMITVYIAPYVYWIDDPDAEDTVYPEEGYGEPYGMVVDCDSLKLTGLTEKPSEVVLAGNRGQSHGAKGNYTMFFFQVRHLELANLTMGNYCSVDLDYPSCPTLGHKRRTGVITQAQLAGQSGDKLFARNCSFVSRLNLCPVCGGKRCLYVHCHFESTDDALNGRAVYVECDFDFYGSRPLYDTRDSGAVFLGCRFRSRIKGDGLDYKQYFTKESGPVTVVDCEYRCEGDGFPPIGWTKYPRPGLKCYQYQVSLVGCPANPRQFGLTEQEQDSSRRLIVISGEGAPETVTMEGKELLQGYRLETEKGIVYNTFNLLRGMDGWDPMEMKAYALEMGRDRIPTLLKVEITGRVPRFEKMDGGSIGSSNSIGSNSIRSSIIGKEGVILRAKAFYYYGREAENTKITCRVSEQDRAYVKLTEYGDGSCLAEGCSHDDVEHRVLVLAAAPEGLEGAVELTIYPQLMEAPDFLEAPVLAWEEKGSCRLRYVLDSGAYEDRTMISWYRCEDMEGRNPVLTAVTRGEPLRTYSLTDGDAGYYLMAKLVPCHMRSRQGRETVVISERPVTEDDMLKQQCETEDGVWKILVSTDFSSMPVTSQEWVRPGFWTVDCGRPADTMDFAKWEQGDEADCGGEDDGGCSSGCDRECAGEYGIECIGKRDRTPWKYGQTGNGSVGWGFYQNVQGARLLYTPVEGEYGDMKLRLLADPAKTAGQGFGSAGQYMDICIKFDTLSLTGYGVRVIRTAEASDGVRFVPVQYDHGKVQYLSEGVLTSCYYTGCEIMLTAEGQQMRIHGESKALGATERKCGYEAVVDMAVEVDDNPYGGIAIWHTGTPGTGGWQNTTMLHFLEVSLKEIVF